MLSRDSFWVSLSITAHNTQTTNDDSKTLRGPHAPGTRDRTIFRLAVGGCVCTSYTSPKPWLAARRAGGPVGPYSSAPWERLSNTVRLPSDSPPTLPRARWCCPCSTLPLRMWLACSFTSGCKISHDHQFTAKIIISHIRALPGFNNKKYL